MYNLMKQYRHAADVWEDYITAGDRLSSIKQYSNEMLVHSEVSYKVRNGWGSLQHSHWEATVSLDMMVQDKMRAYLFTMATMLYLCSTGLREGVSENALSLVFVYTTIPSVQHLLCLIQELTASKTKTDSSSELFPRVLSMIEMHSHKKLKHVPCFPYSVTASESAVKLVDLNGLGDQHSLVIHRGDRILVGGASGCGKSSMFRQLFRMNTINETLLSHSGYIQWIAENVAPAIDYKYLTMELMFDINPPQHRHANIGTIGHNEVLSLAKLEFVKCFKLDSLYKRCCCAVREDGKGDLKGSKNGKISRPTDKYLVNVSAGEKSRLHSMSCLWRAIYDEQISTIVWDEGDQGLSTDMFVDILQHVDTYSKGKTLICISHCEAAKDLQIWNHKMIMGN